MIQNATTNDSGVGSRRKNENNIHTHITVFINIDHELTFQDTKVNNKVWKIEEKLFKFHWK